MRGKYRMRSCSSRNRLDSVGNVNLTRKRHIGRISIFAAGDNTFNCFFSELDLWDGTSSQDAKNKSISPPPNLAGTELNDLHPHLNQQRQTQSLKLRVSLGDQFHTGWPEICQYQVF